MTSITICPESFIDICLNKSWNSKAINNTVKLLFPESTLDTAQRKKQISHYKAKLDQLRQIPIIEQRSAKWYDTRKNLITASDFAQALGEGKFGTQKQLYQSKCGYDEKPFNSNLPPLKWGNMFEYVAQTIYAQRTGTRIYEFGLIQHPTISYFGASPDGINENGIMLEIKCPYKRKISGEIPEQYYYQIQGQLDVCDLDECDYLECEMKESNCFIPSKNENGLIIEIKSKEKYIYSEVKSWDEKDLEDWKKSQMHILNENDVVFHYWALGRYNVLRVFRDKEFFNDKITLLKEVWDKILQYRKDEELYKKEIQQNNNLIIKSDKKGKKIEIEEFALC